MEEVNFDAAGVKNLNWNTYPIIKFQRGAGGRHRADQPTGTAADGRRRSIIDRHRRGDRQCDLRCRRRAAASGAVHAGQGPACIGKVNLLFHFSTFPLFNFIGGLDCAASREVTPHAAARVSRGSGRNRRTALVPDILEGAQTRPAPDCAAFRIDVHYHGNSPGFIAAIKAHNTGQTALMNWTPAKALEDMDRDGVATSIMSTSEPSVYFGDAAAARALARECNEYVARLVSRSPDALRHVRDAAAARRRRDAARNRVRVRHAEGRRRLLHEQLSKGSTSAIRCSRR